MSLSPKARVGEKNPNWRGGAATLRARQKSSWLKYKYGISLDEFHSLAEAQDNKCAICEKEKKLVVDHDHSDGRVRGLVCGRCNVLLWVLDHPEWMEKAKAYVTFPKAP